MKGAVSAVDVHALVRELQDSDMKIDQVYVHDSKHIILRLYIKNTGKYYLRIELPGLFFLSERAPAAPGRPPNSTLFLRKLIGGSRIIDVRSLPLERTIMITCVKRDVRRTVVIELFDKGNFIVLENNTIKAALEQQEWSARSIRPGAMYEPVQQKVHFLDSDFSEFLTHIDTSQPISKILAQHGGLGGEYAKELCTRCSVDPKHEAHALDKTVWNQLRSSLSAMLDENQPVLYFKEGVMVKDVSAIESSDVFAVAPFVMHSYQDHPKQNFQSFHAAIATAYGHVALEQEDKEVHKEVQKELTKTQKVLQKLKTQQEQLERSAEEYNTIGTYIYEHYQDIELLLEEVRRIEKESDDPKAALNEKFPQVKYNPAARTITFEMRQSDEKQ